MKEFFAFLNRNLFQSFGLPHKFIGMSEEKLISGLPTGDHPFERATAAILAKLTRKTLKNIWYLFNTKSNFKFILATTNPSRAP